MKLQRMEVDNFGVLSGENYDFTDGLNAIRRENGAGKTALAALITAMFYGLDAEGRKRYQPWQGGSWGAKLTFTDGDGSWCIQRSFAADAAGDTCRVTDAGTGVPTDRFGTDMGGTVFGIDRDSFCRCLMVPQNPHDDLPKMTESISGRMVNLIESANKGSYERAAGTLDAAMLTYRNPEGQTGSLDRLDAEAEGYRADLQVFDEKGRALAKEQDRLAEYRLQQQALEESLKNCQELLAEAGTYEANVAKAAAYHEITDQMERIQAEQDYLQKGIFAGGLPEEAELGQIKQDMQELAETRGGLAGSKLSEADQADYDAMRQILDHMSRNEDTVEAELGLARDQLARAEESRNAYVAAANEKQELAEAEAECQALQAQFKNSDHESDLAKVAGFRSDVEVIDRQIAEHEARKAELEKKLAHYNDLKIPNGSSKILLYHILGVVIIIFGCICGLLFHQYALFGLILIGILLEVYGFVLRSGVHDKELKLADLKLQVTNEIEKENDTIKDLQGKRSETFTFVKLLLRQYAVQDMDNDLELLETNIRSNYQDYLTAKNRMEELSAMQQSNELRVQQHKTDYALYMKAFEEVHPEITEPAERMAYLKLQLDRFEGLEVKHQAYQSLEQRYGDLSGEIDTFFGRYPAVAADEVGYAELVRSRDQLLQLNRDMEAKQAEKTAFEAENDIAMILRIAALDVPDEESLKAKEAELTAALARQKEMYERSVDACEALETELSGRSETEGKLAEVENALAAEGTKYGQLQTARRLLDQARDAFAKQHQKKIVSQFTKYMKRLDERTTEIGRIPAPGQFCYTIGDDLGVEVEVNGRIYGIESMSTGYRDMISTCMRLALSDVLYEADKPFLILDHPFGDVDPAKREAMLGLLEEMAQKRQILYLGFPR